MKAVFIEYGGAILAVVLGGGALAIIGSMFFGTEGMLSAFVLQVLQGGV